MFCCVSFVINKAYHTYLKETKINPTDIQSVGLDGTLSSCLPQVKQSVGSGQSFPHALKRDLFPVRINQQFFPQG